jgi:glycosyltransferase involved in cell wall biosynthesis
VICSNVTSLPETIGDDRFLFAPDDAKSLANLILRMQTDTVFRRANIANSAAQAKRLRSINASAFFYDAYRKLLTTVPKST